MMELLEKIGYGDRRAIITVLIFGVLLYMISRYYKNLPAEFRGMINKIIGLGLLLFVIGFFVNPEGTAQVFNTMVSVVDKFLGYLL